MECPLGARLSRRREIQLAFERNETDIYPTATLPTLQKFIGQGFIPLCSRAC